MALVPSMELFVLRNPGDSKEGRGRLLLTRPSPVSQYVNSLSLVFHAGDKELSILKS